MSIHKNIFLLAFLLILSFNAIGQNKKKISYYELDVIRGLFFQPNTIDPYTGVAVEEFADGRKKMQVPIKDGKINGTVKEWAVNGEKIFEAEYIMGEQTGTEYQWFANGQPMLEVPYVKGQAEGVCKEWFKNGQLKSEGRFHNGKEEGEHKWWFSNGQPDQEVLYKNGKAEGLVKNWYETGHLKLESEYRQGMKNGQTIRYYANGQKESETNFIDNKEQGESHSWSKSGLLEGIQIFDAGTIVKEYNYRSGSIYLGQGYLQVFNEKESFFTVEIKGPSVFPRRTTGVSSYSVEGDLLQLYNYPVSNFSESPATPAQEQALLREFTKGEAAILNEKYGVELAINNQPMKTTTGKDLLYWSFVVPDSFSQREGSQKVVEEHFLSMICNQQVLNMHSVVMEGGDPEQIKRMLTKIAETVRLEKERIDLNTVLEKS